MKINSAPKHINAPITRLAPETLKSATVPAIDQFAPSEPKPSVNWSKLMSKAVVTTWETPKSHKKMSPGLSRDMFLADDSAQFEIIFKGALDPEQIKKLTEERGFQVTHIAGEIYTARNMDKDTLETLARLKSIKCMEGGIFLPPAQKTGPKPTPFTMDVPQGFILR